MTSSISSLESLEKAEKQALGDGDAQGGLACCSPWGHRVRHDLGTKQQQQQRKKK